MRSIVIAEDFSRYPGGRFRKNGRGSGEEFRDDILLPAMEQGGKIIIILDGTSGYPASFLEEAFGGLVRAGKTEEQIRDQIEVQAGEKYRSYVQAIWQYVERAAKRQQVAA